MWVQRIYEVPSAQIKIDTHSIPWCYEFSELDNRLFRAFTKELGNLQKELFHENILLRKTAY